MIYLLHCKNSIKKLNSLNGYDSEIKEIILPCTGKVTEIYLLKAFSTGADGVLVLGCPEGECNFIKGNLHAISRVKRTRQYLDEVGLGSERLEMHVVSTKAEERVANIIKEMVDNIKKLGPSPINK